MPRAELRKNNSKRSSKATRRSQATVPDISWIRALAEPYLRDYRPVKASRGTLRGYKFVPPQQLNCKVGFFIGYLLDAHSHEFLNPAPPEAIVFAYLNPVESSAHRHFVAQEGSLLRKTAEYIGWLTHRPPRFAFFDNREVVLARHISMGPWPRSKYVHFSRNFFIETLAWLVRSGLVRKLRGAGAPLSEAGAYEKRKG